MSVKRCHAWLATSYFGSILVDSLVVSQLNYALPVCMGFPLPMLCSSKPSTPLWKINNERVKLSPLEIKGCEDIPNVKKVEEASYV